MANTSALIAATTIETNIASNLGEVAAVVLVKLDLSLAKRQTVTRFKIAPDIEKIVLVL